MNCWIHLVDLNSLTLIGLQNYYVFNNRATIQRQKERNRTRNSYVMKINDSSGNNREIVIVVSSRLNDNSSNNINSVK